MGFLKKLFGMYDETDELIEKIRENQKLVKKSPNYQFCCVALRDAFFESSFEAADFYNNKICANKVISRAFEICTNNLGVSIPLEYKTLPLHFVSTQTGDKFGFILEFSDVRYECECNYVALFFNKGKKLYYMNEVDEPDSSV